MLFEHLFIEFETVFCGLLLKRFKHRNVSRVTNDIEFHCHIPLSFMVVRLSPPYVREALCFSKSIDNHHLLLLKRPVGNPAVLPFGPLPDSCWQVLREPYPHRKKSDGQFGYGESLSISSWNATSECSVGIPVRTEVLAIAGHSPTVRWGLIHSYG
jgi:hypothetical protein